MAPLLFVDLPVLMRLLLVGLLSAAGAGGCAQVVSSPAGSPAQASQAPGAVASDVGIQLPSSGNITACAGEQLDGPIILTATPDRRIVGLMDHGTALTIYWPTGFRAVFAPTFMGIVDDRGKVFATPGEDVNADLGRWHGLIACTTLDGIWVLAPHD